MFRVVLGSGVSQAAALGGGFGEQEQGFAVPQQAGGALPCPVPHHYLTTKPVMS